MKLTDISPMPFGKHKGTPMANVPDSYLLWLYNQYKVKSESAESIPQFGYDLIDYVDDYGIENLNP